MSAVESYLTEAPRHRPRWYGDLGIVAGALVVLALVASTLSWCDFSLQSYKLAAPLPVFLCPGGPSAGEVREGETVRFTSTYSGSHGSFTEVSAGGGVAGWAEGEAADAASGVTTSEIFGLPAATDPAFDGPDCTSPAPTTSTTTETTDTTVVPTTVVQTTVVQTTVAEIGATTVAPTTTPRTTAPRRTTVATPATTATTLPTTATTEPTTTTTTDTDGPLLGPVRLRPSTITEQVVGAAAVCGNTPTVAQLTVTASDPSGIASVVAEAQVKGKTESATLSSVDELYSGTVGPFTGLFSPNDKASSALIAVVITATDLAGNVSTANGTGTLLRCVPPATTSSTTTTFIIF